MGAVYTTISSLLLAGKSDTCYVINAICYVINVYITNAICFAIGRLRRECYLPQLEIQQRCDTSAF